MSTAAAPPRRIAIVGWGHLGQYLVECMKASPHLFTLACVWARDAKKLEDDRIPPAARCVDLAHIADFTPDLIVEVCHPSVTIAWGEHFLSVGDFYIGSPTALADDTVRCQLEEACKRTSRAVYVPTGAMWGAEDIRRMADRGTLASLTVTMAKHPASMKLEGDLGDKVTAMLEDMQKRGLTPTSLTSSMPALVLYDGCVKDLCPLAPNNVNTMAAASIAAHNLGFGKVQAQLIADPSLTAHVITITACGKPLPDGSTFRVHTDRSNPAAPGAVTGTATYASFYSSLLATTGKHGGIYLC